MTRWILFLLAMSLAPRLAPAGSREELARLSQTSPNVLDLIAVATLDEGVEKLTSLLRRYRGTAQEWGIRVRIAETLRSKASLYPRLRDGAAGKKNYDGEFKSTLKAEIDQLNALIASCSKHTYCADSYLLRGVAWKALENPDLAAADFRYVLEHYRNSGEADETHFHLGELEIEKGDYRNAIVDLELLKNKRDFAFYPLVLERLSWAYLAVGDYPKALAITADNLKYLTSGRATQPREMLRPGVLALNAAIFYAKAIDSRRGEYDGAQAAHYFITQLPGELLPIALKTFPSLITRVDLAPEIDAFAEAVVKALPETTAAWGVSRVALEKAIALRRMDAVEARLASLSRGVDDYSKWVGDLYPTLHKAESNLLSYLAEEKGRIAPNERVKVARLLKTVYGLGAKSFQQNSLASTQFRFNLAAIAFTEKDYVEAESQFREVVESRGAEAKAQALRDKAEMQSIRVRYYRLLTMKAGEREGGLLKEWDKWVVQRRKQQRSLEGIDALALELARGQDLSRLNRFLVDFPQSPLRVDAAKLLMTAHTEQERWDELYDLTEKLKTISWPRRDFLTLIHKVQGEAAFHRVRLAGQPPKPMAALAMAEKLLPTVERPEAKEKILSIAADAAVAADDRSRAVSYLDRIEMVRPSPANRYRRSLLRGTIAEAMFDLEEAVGHYLEAFALQKQVASPAKEQAGLHYRIQLLVTVAGNPRLLQRTLATPGYCGGKDKPTCQELALLLETKRQRPERVLAQASRNPYLTYAALSQMLPQLGGELRSERMALRKTAFTTFNQALLKRRIDAIHQYERRVQKLEKAKLAELTLLAQENLAGVYQDFSDDLKSLQSSLTAKGGAEAQTTAQIVGQMAEQMTTRARATQAGNASPATIPSEFTAAAGNEKSRQLKTQIVSSWKARQWVKSAYLIELGRNESVLSPEETELATKTASLLLAQTGREER